MLKFPEREKGLEKHCQILRILISSRTMSIHLAGWAINQHGARAVKKQRFLNISLVWIRSIQNGEIQYIPHMRILKEMVWSRGFRKTTMNRDQVQVER